MKQIIIGWAIVMLCVPNLLFKTDSNAFDRYFQHEKFAAEEAAAAAAQIYIKEEYAEGRIVFNKTEAIQAAEDVIKKQLHLDNNLMPLPNTYLTEKVNYTIEFFDHSNSTFPFLYEHDVILFTQAIGDPTVVITIYAGPGRFRTLDDADKPQLIRAAAHEWKAP